MMGPLEGIRVLELANYIAVPAAGSLLAELGADVVKVEVPWGEVYRHATPRRNGYANDFPIGLLILTFNFGNGLGYDSRHFAAS